MSTVIIKKPRPLFRPELKRAPAHPIGERVLVREFPVESTTEGGLAIADIAKRRYFAGELLAVGDQAADKLYDLGVEIGDEVWYGQYAGLVEEWQHIVAEGVKACTHDAAWDYVAKDDHAAWSCVGQPNDNMQLRACRLCGAKKLTERVIVLSVDDIVLDVDLEVRFERGDLVRKRGIATDGKTRYYLERKNHDRDSLERRT